MSVRFTLASGSNLRCRGWRQEGLLRLLENVLAVGEDPDNLVVYAALGKAARDWPSHDKIVETLRTMAEDETLIVQSGKPIGATSSANGRRPRTSMHGRGATLVCWGGLMADDWRYIGAQG